MKKLTISNQQKFFSLINQKGKICARLTYQIFRDKNLARINSYTVPKECTGAGLLYDLFIKFAEKAYSLGCDGIAIPFTNLTPYEIASDVFDFGENLRLIQPKCQLKDVLINDSSESLNPNGQIFVVVWKFNPRDLNDG